MRSPPPLRRICRSIARDGGFVPGRATMPALDETRALRDESRRAGRRSSGALRRGNRHRAPLRIKHNNVLGYFIEVNARRRRCLLQPP
jgi:DNA mismatch repair protein MutS